MTLIGLTGHAGAGKTTATVQLERLGFTRYAFSEPVKELCAVLFPGLYGEWDAVRWERMKRDNITVREELQRVGVGCRDILGDNVWINVIYERIIADGHAELAKSEAGLTTLEITGDVVIDGVRFPNEVEWIRSKGGVIVNIRRPGLAPINSAATETSLNHDEADYTVPNREDRIVDMNAVLTDLVALLNNNPTKKESINP